MIDDRGDAHVLSVNVGGIRDVEWRGRHVRTAIWKSPVAESVQFRGVNAAGDDQADRTVHGGPDKAVYVYAAEDYEHWAAEGVAIEPGLFGDNLTVQGIDCVNAVIGERWRVGTALFEVAQPRQPCYKLGIRMDDPHFPRRFYTVGRFGVYLRIVAEGTLRAGDTITILSRPDHGVTVWHIADALRHPATAHRLLAAPQLPESWREWVLERPATD